MRYLKVLVVPCLLLSVAKAFSFRSAAHHLLPSFGGGLPPLFRPSSSVLDLANAEIPRRDGGVVYAYRADPDNRKSSGRLLILVHEFFGLSDSICRKADALAKDLNCAVVAPDMFRGISSTFIPRCIWLALSTPQGRVNQDLDDVVRYMQNDGSTGQKLAVMGFCYGGGKAIRYTCECAPSAATVVCYGSPVTDPDMLRRLRAPLCGVFGRQDVQFPPPVLEKFQTALEAANVEANICVYEGVGHAFWKDMEQIQRQEQPQTDAYHQITEFLNKFYSQ